jgi:hypothetical protein
MATMPRAPKTPVSSPRLSPAGKKASGSFAKGDPRAAEAGRKGGLMGGRPAGAKSVVSEAKIKFLAQTGQTPLEFLTAVYRDQLYSEYDVEEVDAKKGLFRVWPKLDPITGGLAKGVTKISVELGQRISAATAAAPYVHRKMPIGIDGGEGKPLAFVSADRLAELSDAELAKLLDVLGRLGVGAEFEGTHPKVDRLEE